MTNYQEKRIVALLDRMAKTIADYNKGAIASRFDRIENQLAYTVGGLEYLVGEARETLDLPAIDGVNTT